MAGDASAVDDLLCANNGRRGSLESLSGEAEPFLESSSRLRGLRSVSPGLGVPKMACLKARKAKTGAGVSGVSYVDVSILLVRRRFISKEVVLLAVRIIVYYYSSSKGASNTSVSTLQCASFTGPGF